MGLIACLERFFLQRPFLYFLVCLPVCLLVCLTGIMHIDSCIYVRRIVFICDPWICLFIKRRADTKIKHSQYNKIQNHAKQQKQRKTFNHFHGIFQFIWMYSGDCPTLAACLEPPSRCVYCQLLITGCISLNWCGACQ